MVIMIKMKNKKNKYLKPGVAGIFIAFIFISIVLIFLFAVGIPFLMAWNTQMYAAGEQIMSDSSIQSAIDSISDATMKAEIEGIFTVAKSSTADNVSILGFFYQYGWIIIIIITCLMLFMKTRVLVETQTSIV